jgi:hypothetical protein
MSEENHPSQYPEWQEYLETVSSLPYVDTPSQPSSASPPQSASRPSQQPAIRTEIDQLVAIHQLGKVQREYKNEVSKTLAAGLSSCMLGVLCFLPLILLLFTQVGYFSGLRWTFIIGFGLLSYGIDRITVAINNIGTNMLYHNPRCYLCSHGVMSIKGKQVQAIRWNQIRSVQKIFPTGTSSIPQQYILYPPGDKEPLVLDRVSTGFRILGKQIEREVTRHLLPETLAAYKAGQTLNFGAINVTPQGLSLEETRKDLPWNKLGAIDENRGYLVIKEKGTLSTWENIEVSAMLNLCVLLQLIRQIKYDNRIRGNGQSSLSSQPPANDPLQQSEWQEYE